MLSPHEFATLILISEAPDQIETNRDEIQALREHELVIFEMLSSGHQMIQITPQGRAVLKAVGRAC